MMMHLFAVFTPSMSIMCVSCFSIQNWVEDLYWKQLDIDYPGVDCAMVCAQPTIIIIIHVSSKIVVVLHVPCIDSCNPPMLRFIMVFIQLTTTHHYD